MRLRREAGTAGQKVPLGTIRRDSHVSSRSAAGRGREPGIRIIGMDRRRSNPDDWIAEPGPAVSA